MCDYAISIGHILKSDQQFSKRNFKPTKNGGDGHVYDFGEDIAAIRAIAERIELRFFAIAGAAEETLRDFKLLMQKLTDLRMDAPHSMICPKEETLNANAGPKTVKSPAFKKPGEEEAKLLYTSSRRSKARVASLGVPETP